MSHGHRPSFGHSLARTLTRGVKVMDDPGLRVRVSRELRNTYALSFGRGGAGCTILLRAENTAGDEGIGLHRGQHYQ